MIVHKLVVPAVSVAMLLVVSSSSAATDPDTTRASPPTASRGAIYGSAGVGSVLDKPGGAAPAATTSLRLALPLARVLALELMGTTGYAIGRGTPDDFWARLAIGLRVEDSARAFRPYGALRLVHQHYASVSTWEDHPGASIAGSSNEGLQHRSGTALAGGLSWTLPRTGDRVRAMAEVEVSWVPVGDGPAWFATTELGIGYAF
jgi:hypothetical protein